MRWGLWPQLGWVDEFVPLFLAPQAGISDAPFRLLCREFGADVVVSELVSAEGLRRGGPRSWQYLGFEGEERPIGVQLFGADPAALAEAAALVEAACQPDFVDINFGCPVKKVVNRNGGASCLRDPALLQRIIRAVVQATTLPVTVKIRSGWCQDTRRPVDLALSCEQSGARMLTLHPRTRAQMFSGQADWSEIGAVAAALEIPVVGNGDVRSGSDALAMLDRTGCAGVMIARGSHGAPWVFRAARAALDGHEAPPEPGVAERLQVILAHLDKVMAFHEGDGRAVFHFRKHLGWYTRKLPEGRRLRQELYQVASLEEVREVLEGHLLRYSLVA